MRHSLINYQDLSFLKEKKPVVTIGNFDGVHQGHQEIISFAQRKAKENNTLLVGLTFFPHPKKILSPENPLILLMSYEQKYQFLKTMGVDVLYEHPFTLDFSEISPKEFFHCILQEKLGAQKIIIGDDFRFGNKRQGDNSLLWDLCHHSQMELFIVPGKEINGKRVSSSSIRQLLQEKKLKEAAEFLGRPFFFEGKVLRGEGRGETLGFPTANFLLPDYFALPYGVYAVNLLLDNKHWQAVANIGIRPTFSQTTPASIEVHIIEKKLSLYDQIIKVNFISFLREEKKFSHINDLKNQIQNDIENAKNILKKNNSNEF